MIVGYVATQSHLDFVGRAMAVKLSTGEAGLTLDDA